MNTIISLLTILGLLAAGPAQAQQRTKRILFLGNSYTAWDNLPSIVSEVATSAGDSLDYQAVTPGGETLWNHSQSATVQNLIAGGGWDVILMQEQSQVPTIPYYRNTLFEPGASALEALRTNGDPCARMLFFLTWGRENGGQQCGPQGQYCSAPFADFDAYQDTLTAAYQTNADRIGAGIAPVGEVWRAARNAAPASLQPLNLFSSDGSHPSATGSYLAALAVYASAFRRPVDGKVTFNGPLGAAKADFFRQVVDSIVWPRRAEWRLRDTTSLAGRYGWLTAGSNDIALTDSLSTDSLQLGVAGLRPGVAATWTLGGSLVAPGRPLSLARSALDSLPRLQDSLMVVQLQLTDTCDTLQRTDTIVVPVNDTTGRAAAAQAAWRIGPNPSAGDLNVHAPPQWQSAARLVLRDPLGRDVRAWSLSSGRTHVSIRDLRPGLYSLTIHVANGRPVFRKKLVLQ